MKVFILATMVVFISGDHAPFIPIHAPVHHKPSYHTPVVHHAPVVHHEPSYHAPEPHHAPVYHEEKPHPFTYEYGVHDDYHGTTFDAGETQDEYGNREGHYSVLLPDGRTQHVKYHVNGYDGYVADVTYEGHQVPYHAPAPVHHAPAPAYHAPPHHA